MTLYAATANLQGVTDPQMHVLMSALGTLPGMGVTMFQELGRVRLRDKVSQLMGVRQGEGPAKGGVGLVWDRDRVDLAGSGLIRMCPAVPGEMRTRYLVWANLESEHGRITYASTHRPLPRLQAARDRFDVNLRAFVAGAPHPVVIGLDANGTELPLAGLGVEFRRMGIDGFVMSKVLDHGPLFRLPQMLSDHRGIGVRVGPR